MATSSGPIVLKSEAAHSPMLARLAMWIRLSGKSRVWTPCGVTQAMAAAARPKPPQRRTTGSRPSARAASRASSATGPISARPKKKLPCRLAHRAISGSTIQRGPRPSARARISSAVQISRIGKATMCGRASRLPVQSSMPKTSTVTQGKPLSQRPRSRASSQAVSAAAAPASSITPLQPARLKAPPNSTSDSHS